MHLVKITMNDFRIVIVIVVLIKKTKNEKSNI